MKILLIEDNKDISDAIKNILTLDWFQITQVFDGKQGLQIGQIYDFDCIVLDLNLPSLDGISVCKKLRETKNTPLIMITAKWDDDDKILGLESGADDYIVKPFKIKELEIRIQWLLKRSWITDTIIIENIEIDLKSKTVKKDGEKVNLKLKEFQLLEYILKHKTVSRTDIIDYLWWSDDVFFWDNNLDVYISSLRRKLNKDIITTIKWYGYSIKQISWNQ